jgi:UDP-N-acetylglucosamine--N-acetylmuramyl-(pentapeptide) pyrophosphoryl-undecaprenol N-acetylglucosamine transferase
MPAAYRDSDFVISRAGAGAVSELAAAGRPSLLVPFPFAADDHQRHNAEALARNGAALVLADANSPAHASRRPFLTSAPAPASSN